MNCEELSTSESAIYDRQIRLWGASSQLRIKSSTVFFVGITHATVEILKNTVLAGTSAIVEDDRSIDPSNRNFLIALESTDSDHASVGEATAVAARRLNEHPKITVFRNSEGARDSTIVSASAVVVSLRYISFDAIEAIRVSDLCRESGVGFFLILDSMPVSWMFSDFGKKHVVESHTATLKRDERTGERKAEAQMEYHEFARLSEYIASEVEGNVSNGKASFPSKEILFAKFFLEHRSKQGREWEGSSPKRSRQAESMVKGRDLTFLEFLDKRIAQLSTLTGKVGKYFAACKADVVIWMEEAEKQVMSGQGALPHTAAVLGALVSQEVIKFVTKRDRPLVNQIVINPRDFGAIVVKMPSRLVSEVVKEDGPVADNEVEIVVSVGQNDILDI